MLRNSFIYGEASTRLTLNAFAVIAMLLASSELAANSPATVVEGNCIGPSTCEVYTGSGAAAIHGNCPNIKYVLKPYSYAGAGTRQYKYNGTALPEDAATGTIEFDGNVSPAAEKGLSNETVTMPASGAAPITITLVEKTGTPPQGFGLPVSAHCSDSPLENEVYTPGALENAKQPAPLEIDDGPKSITGVNTSFPAAEANAAVNDLFKTFAAMAIDRTKKKGARYAIRQVSEELGCYDENNNKFANTCGILENLDVSSLSTSGKALRKAFLTDIFVNAGKALFDDVSSPDAKFLADVFANVIFKLVASETLPDRQDGIQILNNLVNRQWHRDELNAIFQVVRACSVKKNRCNVAMTVNALEELASSKPGDSYYTKIKGYLQNSEERQMISNGAHLSVRILSSDVETSSEKLQRAFQDVIALSFLTLEMVVTEGESDGKKKALVTVLHDAVAAAMKKEIAQTVASSSKLLAMAGGQKLSQQSHAFLIAVGEYAESYHAETAEQAAEARKQALENLMEAAADRSNRDGDPIWSVGINTGTGVLGGQYQWDADSKNTMYYPQLSLPLGIGLTVTGHTKKHDMVGPGFYWQVSFFDLGQFAAYNEDGDLAEPSWKTSMMIGMQAGLIIGNQNNPFNICAEVRYAPGIEFDNGEMGVLRYGLFIGYYVPFYDFN